MSTTLTFCHSLRLPVTSAFFAILALAPFLTLTGQESSTTQEGKKEKNATMLRLVCIAEMKGEEEFVIASKDEDGKWIEHQEIKLRTTFITEWVKVAEGRLFLTQRSGDTLVSRCTFTYPASARRAVALILPDKTKGNYLAHVIDPTKENFSAGKILLVNYSSTPGIVMLGSRRTDVKPGKSVVVKPQAGEDGMFRMVVGYPDKEGKVVACYDRYIPGIDKSRDFLFLLPDPVLGLRVMPMSEFGPFE